MNKITKTSSPSILPAGVSGTLVGLRGILHSHDIREPRGIALHTNHVYVNKNLYGIQLAVNTTAFHAISRLEGNPK